MSSRWAPPRWVTRKAVVVSVVVGVIAVMATLVATSGADARPSSTDVLMDTVAAAAAAANGRQPSDIVAGVAGNGRSAALFDSNGNRLAGDALSLFPLNRIAALGGRTVVDVGGTQTAVTAALPNNDVLVVQQAGAPTGFQLASTSRFQVVVVAVLIGLLGVGLGRLTAPRGRWGPAATPNPDALPAQRVSVPHATAPATPYAEPAAGTQPPVPPAEGAVVPQPGAPRPEPGVVARSVPATPSTPAAPPPNRTRTPSSTSNVDQVARTTLPRLDSASNPEEYRAALAALAEAGLTLYDPIGEQFDPSQHLAVGRRDTADPNSHNRVAETIRLGCYGDGRVLREAEVVVCRLVAGDGQ